MWLIFSEYNIINVLPLYRIFTEHLLTEHSKFCKTSNFIQRFQYNPILNLYQFPHAKLTICPRN